MEMTDGRRVCMRLAGALFMSCFAMHLLAGFQNDADTASGLTVLTGLLQCLFLPAFIGLLLAKRLPAAIGFALSGICELVTAWPDLSWYAAHAGSMTPDAFARLFAAAAVPSIWLLLCALACIPWKKHIGRVFGIFAAFAGCFLAVFYFTAMLRWSISQSFFNWSKVAAEWTVTGSTGLMQQQLIENTALFFGGLGSIFLAVSLFGRPKLPEAGELPPDTESAGVQPVSEVIARLSEAWAELERGEITSDVYETRKRDMLQPLLQGKQLPEPEPEQALPEPGSESGPEAQPEE